MAEPDAKTERCNVRSFETVRNEPLSQADIAALEEFVIAAKEGRVVAYAIVAKETGYSRWSSWRTKIRSDRYNILGQLIALTTEIANDTERQGG